jgi:hypothetical protein
MWRWNGVEHQFTFIGFKGVLARGGQKVQRDQNFSDHTELYAYAAHIQKKKILLKFKVFNK